MATPPTLDELGLGTMTQNGRPADGRRPLLVVLIEYSNFPAFATWHPTTYYEQLAFGQPVPPFTTRDPVNPASIAQYFLENSNGNFTFSRVDVVGPIGMGMLNDPGPEARTALILTEVARRSPQLFIGLDADGNQALEFDELCVLLIENIPKAQPANRDNNPVVIQVPSGDTEVTVSVVVHFAGAGPLTPFYQIAHEVSHCLGTVDLYNVGNGNYGVTLMSGYPFYSDDQGSVHLDAWHKLRLGWIEPQIMPLSIPGSAEISDSPASGLVLWDDARRETEFFLLERRTPTSSARQYDGGVAGDGVCIWRVTRSSRLAAHLGAPDLAVGGSGVWPAGSQTPGLSWEDGSSTGRALSVTAATDGALRVAWGEDGAHVGGTRHLTLSYGGNGTTPVDSGLPLIGVFYGVTANGDLEWNRYLGAGARIDEAQSSQDWAPNTRNLIGRGFGSMRQVFACGDGVVMAVHPNGDLYWYRYDGNGEPDVTGARGWDPNSGNVIGRGWNGFVDIFVMPQAGHASSRMRIFGVAANGDLHWYSYSGNGEADPTGALGWHPNSGHRVGRGWQDFDHLHGSGSTVFAIRGDELLWYTYVGQGEEDVTGATGWVAGSGNTVGHGWAGLAHVFGGVSDVGDFGHILYGVTTSGDLRWSKYTGDGAPVGTGTSSEDWHPRSGSLIGRGW
jgi:M6 family metalloprotease-like protein